MGITPYYQDDYVTLYNGDCREIVPQLGKFDLALCDPPYGISKEEWDNVYPLWCESLCFSVADKICITPGLWGIGQCIAQMGDKYKWVIAGYKPDGLTNGKIGINKWQPAVVGGDIGRIGSDAFRFSQRDIGGGVCGHSCQKPLGFIKWLVEKLSDEGDSIIDIFAGSGTTGRAAKDLQRKCTMIELEERYCEIAANRCRQEVLPL